MAGIFSQGGSAGHRYAGWLSEVEAKNFQFGGKVFNGSPSAIFVGNNLVWTYWLKAPAMTAIYGAFGQRDGMAVIKATNAYLNQLAASGQAGKDKATALAGFINEDPMMVCSLGLEVEGVTMPIRWLVGDTNGAAYIDTDFIPGNLTTIEMSFKINEIHSSSQHSCLFGSRATYSSRTISWGWGNSGWQMTGSQCFTSWGLSANYQMLTRPLDTQQHTVKLDKGNYIIDGTSVYQYPQSTFTCPYNLYVFNLRQDSGLLPNGLDSDGYVAYFKVWEDGEPIAHMIPCKHNGQNGMYDIERMRWFGNANSSGSFTIPDISYTPSTP